jgi:hypothetical protein
MYDGRNQAAVGIRHGLNQAAKSIQVVIGLLICGRSEGRRRLYPVAVFEPPSGFAVAEGVAADTPQHIVILP